MITALDLFSGYGGISYGLRDYIKPIAYCEIDRYARAILASRISEGELGLAPIFPDVRRVRGQVGAADIIVGGFPCQDISTAGLGKGLGGERSGLFFEIVRLTKEIKPTFVFLENVPAIRTRGLRQVIGAFAEVGYDCRWTCLSAASVGAPHKRERWFLLAHTNVPRLEWKSGPKQSIKKELNSFERICSTLADSDFSGGARIGEVVTQSANEKQVDRHDGHGAEPRSLHSRGNSHRGKNENWWSTEPNVGRVVNGCAFRVDRIKALGNGVVPLQVKTAFEKLMGITLANI